MVAHALFRANGSTLIFDSDRYFWTNAPIGPIENVSAEGIAKAREKIIIYCPLCGLASDATRGVEVSNPLGFTWTKP